MTITEALETILGARYGRDVRQAIHDGIKQAYDDGTANGNANMEVSQARGKYPTLAERLNETDDKQRQTTAQLDQKVDKNGNEQITWAMASQDFKEQITGGNTAVVGENSVNTSNIVDGAVNTQKTGLNLKNFIKKDFTPILTNFTDGYFLYNKTYDTVSIRDVINFRYSDVIPLKKGQTVIVDCKGFNDVLAVIVSCDVDGSNIKPLVVSENSNQKWHEYTARDDMYVRVSGQSADFNTFGTYDDLAKIKNEEKVNLLTNKVDGIYNPTYENYANKFVSTKGVLTNQNAYDTTDIIQLKIGEKITIIGYGSVADGIVSFLSSWDSSGQIFKGNLHTANGTKEVFDYVASEDIEYLRVSYMRNNPEKAPLLITITNSDNLTFKNILKKDISTIEKEYLKVLVNKVTTVGDSLTAGGYYGYGYNGDAIKENYPYMLAKMTGWQVTNSSSNGATARTWVTRHASTTDFASSDLVIIGLGTNGALTDTIETDTANDIFADTETGQYCWIVNEFRTQNPDVHIFLGLIAGPTHDETTNAVIEKIAQKYGCGLLDDSELRGVEVMHPFGNTLHYGKVGNVYKAKLYYEQILNQIASNLGDYEILLDEH